MSASSNRTGPPLICWQHSLQLLSTACGEITEETAIFVSLKVVGSDAVRYGTITNIIVLAQI